MKFDLESPGLIVLNQFKAKSLKDNINNYWYISTEGIEFFSKNLGVLSNLNLTTNYFLDLIVKHYQSQFEFVFEKVDLGFFDHWSCIQIQINSSPSKSHYSNVSLFLNNLNIDHHFEENTLLYSFKDFPQIKTQLDVYHFVNSCIYQHLSSLFLEKNIEQSTIEEEDFKLFPQYSNKIEFLEKVRLKKKLEKKLPLKNNLIINKI